MAERKKPETRPQLAGAASEHDKRKHTVAMTAQQFNNVVRFILTTSSGQLTQLREAATGNLKRLRLRRTAGAAYKGPAPDGSDQVDIRSWTDWMDKIPARDRDAEAQLLVLDATLATRG